MKTLFFILFPLLSAGELSTGQALLTDWDGCLRRLESFEATRRNRVPDAIWDMEPGLRALRLAVPRQRDVLEMTRARFEPNLNEMGMRLWQGRTLLGPEVGAAERHLVENGVQGCERFRTGYEARAKEFLLLLAAFGSLILVLTARMGLAMVPATSPGASDVQDTDHSPPPRSSSGVS